MTKKKTDGSSVNNRQKSTKSRNRANIGLVIALCIVSALFVTTTALWLGGMGNSKAMARTMNSVYEQNYYDLVDNVNNAEVKMSKVLASTNDAYSKKLLTEINKNISNASNNLNNLPISMNGVDETKSFMNQCNGYTTYICNKLDKGETLTSAEKDTLEEIYASLNELKQNLGEFDEDMSNGYNIFKNGKLVDGEFNGFTKKLQGLKTSDTEYPTMIYDGPFSDKEYNKEIKNLNYNLISAEEGKQVIKNLYQTLQDNQINYKTETKSKFNTFDYQVELTDNITLYVQVTQNGGKLLTVSGYGDLGEEKITLSEAIIAAKNFAQKDAGVQFECVWNDIVGNDAYINLAPVQNGVILYPDLIKVKIDLSSGSVIGYSSGTFYMNHTKRNLPAVSIEQDTAVVQVPGGYAIESKRLCIAPIDFVDDILCYEFKCTRNDATYYIYINAQTGETENILRVIETTDGNKLM